MRIEKYSKAIQDFDTALTFSPQNPTIISQRAVAKYLNQNHKDALIDFDLAQNIEPQNPYRYSSRAYIKAIIGDVQGAIDDYKQALALDPEDAVTWNNLGLLEEQLGYQKEAQEKFKRADKIADEGKTFEKPSLDEIITKYQQKQKDIRDSLNLQKINDSYARGIKGYWQVIKKVFTDKNTNQEFWRFVRNLGRKS
jgi:tetratricopeptide (TPR) repeat protein